VIRPACTARKAEASRGWWREPQAFLRWPGSSPCEAFLDKHEDLTVKPKESHRSFHYQSRLVWDAGRVGRALIVGKPVMRVSSPQEFKGDPACWSPEDMLVAAADACLLMTFLAYAQREELEVVRYESEADAAMEFTDGRYRFTEVVLRPHLKFRTQEDAEIARMVLELAHRDCIITNSITAAVKLEPEICAETGP
jgi:peroxiredoxin-like protein